jgi:hypothetical protein
MNLVTFIFGKLDICKVFKCLFGILKSCKYLRVDKHYVKLHAYVCGYPPRIVLLARLQPQEPWNTNEHGSHSHSYTIYEICFAHPLIKYHRDVKQCPTSVEVQVTICKSITMEAMSIQNITKYIILKSVKNNCISALFDAPDKIECPIN